MKTNARAINPRNPNKILTVTPAILYALLDSVVLKSGNKPLSCADMENGLKKHFGVVLEDPKNPSLSASVRRQDIYLYRSIRRKQQRMTAYESPTASLTDDGITEAVNNLIKVVHKNNGNFQRIVGN